MSVWRAMWSIAIRYRAMHRHPHSQQRWKKPDTSRVKTGLLLQLHVYFKENNTLSVFISGGRLVFTQASSAPFKHMTWDNAVKFSDLLFSHWWNENSNIYLPCHRDGSVLCSFIWLSTFCIRILITPDYVFHCLPLWLTCEVCKGQVLISHARETQSQCLYLLFLK